MNKKKITGFQLKPSRQQLQKQRTSLFQVEQDGEGRTEEESQLNKKSSVRLTKFSTDEPTANDFYPEDEDDDDELKRRSEKESASGKKYGLQTTNNSNIGVYAYDEVYDIMKDADTKAKLKTHGVSTEREPKYISGMMKQAFERTKQNMRYQERKLQRELEEELSNNPDLNPNQMERFVTDAYREQQAEIRRIEEEEKRLASAEEAKGKRNYAGFYKNLLEMRSNVGAAAVEESMKASELLITNQTEPEVAKVEVEYDKPLIEKTADGEQILSAGLNILNRRKPAAKTDMATHKSYADYVKNQPSTSSPGRYLDKHDERLKITEEFENQLKQQEEESTKQRQVEEEKVREKLKRKTTEDAINEAKRRAEERRKARIKSQ